MKIYRLDEIEKIPQLAAMGPERLFEIAVVGSVFPFRLNEYVVEQLIDWRAAPDDPMYRIVVPVREMLDEESYASIAGAMRRGASKREVADLARAVQSRLNPHPADQITRNLPKAASGDPVNGLQHKYPETVLFFPSAGQTCHAYCTFCFRWAQFVHDDELRIATLDSGRLIAHLREHPEVTDVLVTGGDPFIMKARRIKALLARLVHPEFEHVQSIRFGTKALSFWPQRFVTDPDADELLDVLRWLARCGKHVAIMVHHNHWRELETDIARQAIARLQSTGAILRSQSPLLAKINDHPDIWTRLWRTQVGLGIVPYYMFVARDTGARSYFGVPLVKAWDIYKRAIERVSGLARTVRGPSMSTSYGKIEVSGVTEVNGERVLALRFLQARRPEWTYRPFFAAYDETATWLDELRPAFGERRFFFQTDADELVPEHA